MADEEGVEEFAKLLACIKQMQAGTTALVRSGAKDTAELAISNVSLVEDLDEIVCKPLDSNAGGPLSLHVGNDIVGVEDAPDDSDDQGAVSLVLKIASGEPVEMVFATDEDCICWRAGLSFLKGALPPGDEEPEEKAPAPAPKKQTKPKAKPQAQQPKPAGGEMAELAQKNRELEAIVRRKEATIQQLLKEAREDDGVSGLPPSAESDAHMKDRVIARLRTENADLKRKLAKKEQAVQSLVRALSDMQSLREDLEDDEEEDAVEDIVVPGTPGTAFRPPSRRAEAPTPTAPRAPAPSPASTRPQREGPTLLPPPQASEAALRKEQDEAAALSGFISDLTTKFDGLESELKEKTALLAELQREEEEAKAEHAALLQQLKEHEMNAGQVRAGMPAKQAPPARQQPPPARQPVPTMKGVVEEDPEEDLLEMQNKVAQLQAMLQMLGGSLDGMGMDDPDPPPPPARAAPAPAPRSVPSPSGPPRGAPPQMMASRGTDPLAGLAGLEGALSGLEGMEGLGGLGDALSGLEEKKRKIEQLAAMLNINLDAPA